MANMGMSRIIMGQTSRMADRIKMGVVAAVLKSSTIPEGVVVRVNRDRVNYRTG
jgi:uncharacterized protein YwbE